jgi:hypothetical protein
VAASGGVAVGENPQTNVVTPNPTPAIPIVARLQSRVQGEPIVVRDRTGGVMLELLEALVLSQFAATAALFVDLA